jgi:hypothetical protein
MISDIYNVRRRVRKWSFPVGLATYRWRVLTPASGHFSDIAIHFCACVAAEPVR